MVQVNGDMGDNGVNRTPRKAPTNKENDLGKKGKTEVLPTTHIYYDKDKHVTKIAVDKDGKPDIVHHYADGTTETEIPPTYDPGLLLFNYFVWCNFLHQTKTLPCKIPLFNQTERSALCLIRTACIHIQLMKCNQLVMTRY